MRLPIDSVIAVEKLTGYLLVRQRRGDKSAFLALAGYTTGTAQQLEGDLREQLTLYEARPAQCNRFGQYYEVVGILRGPNGKRLKIRTIWMTEHLTGVTKFITLIPD
jgi:hypothetical protein